MSQVYSPHGWYPRMIRLQNGDIISSFVHNGDAYVRHSSDNGVTWKTPIMAVPKVNDIAAEVPEILQLNNGWILLATNPRPINIDPSKKFGIKVAISKDNGNTWNHLSDVYEASHEFIDGVWEPAMIQLPSGEVQLFVANEFPYQTSDEQEITMFRSMDFGASWFDTVTVSFRAGSRDGMPVPLILNDNKGIVFSIEDNGGFDGYFKPTIIYTSMEDNWRQGTVGASSDRRWIAMTGQSGLGYNEYGAAPYIDQLPSNETIISFQTNKDRYLKDRGDHPVMSVGIGDDYAKNFSRRSFPFNAPEGHGTWWNSLFIKDSLTVTAVTGTDIYNYGIAEVITKDGHVLSDIKAMHAHPEIDGVLDDSVWTVSSKMFVGAYSMSNVEVRNAWDEDNLYISASVQDENLWGDSYYSVEDDDAIVIYLDPKNQDTSLNKKGIYRYVIGVSGKSNFQEGNGSHGWDDVYENEIIKVININGTINNTDASDVGYNIELSIPWKLIGGRPTRSWGIHYELINDKDGTDADLIEGVAGNKSSKSSTWCKIELLSEHITDIEKNEELAEEFSLSQNYPNPFNPETTIEYKLNKSENITLIVYDLFGREIICLEDSFQQVGNYKKVWNGKTHNGNNLPSGIYLYSLKSLTNSSTKKMILIK